MEHFIYEIDWKLIGKDDDYAEAYKSYQKVCESNGNHFYIPRQLRWLAGDNKEPILDMTAFKSLYTIYGFLCD